MGGLKRNAQLGLGGAVSLVCLWLAFRGLALAEVGRALAGARFWLLALALCFAGVGVRAVRWRRLLLPVAAVRSSRLFPIVVIGYMANDVLPARLGEVVRCSVLRRREGVPTSTGPGTVLPSSPGFVGVFDFLGRSVLGQSGVPAAAALASVPVVHAALVLPVTLLGFWYARRLGGLSLLRPGAPAPPGATGAMGEATVPLGPALQGATG
jgi:uncharacterized membrane protein YbhN (UPF0104 family)